MAEFRRAKTQFVRDRISETKFSDIDFIVILLNLEDNILDPHLPYGFAGHMRYGPYQDERDAIKAEMLEGKITTTREYLEMARNK